MSRSLFQEGGCLVSGGVGQTGHILYWAAGWFLGIANVEKKHPETEKEPVGPDTKGKRSSRLGQSQQIQMLQIKPAIKGLKRSFCF